ncbi:restriction endonuclease [Bacillus thuringiensis]|uniref:Restriction endonuclease n=2 Tax=Bacillus thuringiensis TaxID=1428 RepID=A0A9W3SQU1_BACTU|nr:DUF3578 domain-containing protein [Bacillus thuringiensis]AOM09554.1 hypothetical protein BTI247_11440 [Bacillus thuringiensis Bt18247]MBG9529264.1 restriction endonuclease [Bacillus thuringiensis]
MLDKIIIEFIKTKQRIMNGIGDKSNWLMTIKDNEIYVERKLGIEKEAGTLLDFNVSIDEVLRVWQNFINDRTINNLDFYSGERSNFLVSLFIELPFIEVAKINGEKAITFKEFKTDNLSSEKYDKAILFLEEIMNGTYNPSTLREQTDENLYRMKSNARQDLRLLGFLNESHEMNESLLNEYVQSEDKNIYMTQLVLKQEYFRHALFVLGLLEKYSKDEKKKALVDLAMTIVRNSLGDNLMTISMAKRRTNNLLDWLEQVGLINDQWIPVEQYVKGDGEKGGSMDSNLREGFLRVMDDYLDAKKGSTKGHRLAKFFREDITAEIKSLPFIDDSKYSVAGSAGKGVWASIPWVAIMHKDITTSTQRGYYIVYLFSEDMERLYLTIGQGVKDTPNKEMKKIKQEIRQHIHMSNRVKKDDNIYLGTGPKAPGYANSTAAYIVYDVNQMPDEVELVEDLKEMLHYYEGFINYKEKGIKYEMIYERKEVYLDQQSIIDHVSSYIQSKGFYYEKKDLINFFLSLKTKPFVILSGISGTGKTKIVQLCAESLGATEENGQFTLIPVRPDWSDSSDLLGYVNLQGEFQKRPLIKVLKNADENPNRPYFVVLDEMNLARVEYYFSDFLSVIESRKWKDGKIVTSPVLPESIMNKHITIPSNVYIIGTVNMDETTHPLSKKVLDRANTIEFNTVNLDYFNFLMDMEEKEAEIASNRSLETEYLHLKECFKENEDLVRNISTILIEINKILESVGAQVGYRIRDEICFYMAYNEQGKLLSFDEALDYQIYQKILPRLAGSDGRTEDVLKQLYVLCANEEYDSANNDAAYAKYPRSANKLSHMLRRFEYDGFTSFWI